MFLLAPVWSLILQGTETGLSIWLRSSTAFRKLLEFQVISISFEPVFSFRDQLDSSARGSRFYLFWWIFLLFCWTFLLHRFVEAPPARKTQKKGCYCGEIFNRSSYLWAEKEVKELESILRSKNQITIRLICATSLKLGTSQVHSITST